jgi:hypothetical protein
VGWPATVEWWGLTRAIDVEVDKLMASGSSLFTVGNHEADGNWCPDDSNDGSHRYCGGRFQAHAPWADGMLSWDYGWSPGLKGRVSRDMRSYYNRWTHYALVSSVPTNGLPFCRATTAVCPFDRKRMMLAFCTERVCRPLASGERRKGGRSQ